MTHIETNRRPTPHRSKLPIRWLAALLLTLCPMAAVAEGFETTQTSASDAFEHHDWSRAADLYADLLDSSGHLVTLEERQAWATRRAQALLKERRYTDAVPSLLEARQMAYTSGLQEPELDSLIGWTYLQLGDLPEAIPALEAARQAWKQEREAKEDALLRATMMRQHVHVGRLLQWAHLQAGEAEAAYRVSEEARSQSLVALLAARHPGLLEDRPWTFAEAQELARELSTTIISYTVLGNEERILGNEKPDERMVLIYVIAPDETSAGGQVLTSKSSTPLTDLVLGLRPAMLATDDGEARKTLAELYDLLIRPVAPLLPAPGGSLTILPSGPLHLVPFAALLDRGDEETEASFLIDRYEIRHGLAAAQLEASRQRSAERAGADLGGALIVGHSQSSDSRVDLRPLLAAEREAAAVAKMVGGQALLGPQARKARVITAFAEAPLVHFAAPAILGLDPRRGDLGQNGRNGGARGSGHKAAVAALTREDEARVPLTGAVAVGDSLLFSGEIVSLELGARLAVLSACDVGPGPITREGAVGLRWAFLAAGAPAVVSGLWSRPEAPTAELMTGLYHHLLTGDSASAALRHAMLEVREEYPHPRDWAAFAVTGVGALASPDEVAASGKALRERP